MDLADLNRGFAPAAEASFDRGMLIAVLEAARLAHDTGGGRALGQHGWRGLAVVLLAEDGWRDAARARLGSFEPDEAGRGGKGIETQMTSAFTLAFQPSFKGRG